MMILNPLKWLDKILFAALLVLSLQIPVLTEQYRQYLSGYVDALEKQVAEWEGLASQFGFDSVDSLVRHLMQNQDEVVRADAKLKQETMADLTERKAGLSLLSKANYPRKVIYVFSPKNAGSLKAVLENFTPGIPLKVNSVVYSLVLAIVINIILLMPIWTYQHLRKRKEHKQELVV